MCKNKQGKHTVTVPSRFDFNISSTSTSSSSSSAERYYNNHSFGVMYSYIHLVSSGTLVSYVGLFFAKVLLEAAIHALLLL